MAKKTSMATRKPRRTAVRRKGTTRARRRRLQPAAPPPDNPLLRHEELALDRRIDGEPAFVPGAALEAAMARATGRRVPPRRAARSRKAAAAGTVERMCTLRLEALAESRRLPGDGHPAPARVRARAFSARDPQRIELVPPGPGVSNWVQLGPTVVPNGQTYSAARVRVTGRVTAIVVDPVDPAILYIGTAQGGVWKTIDGGLNWAARTDHEVSLAVGAIAIDPTDRLTLYVGTGEGNFSGDSYYGNGVLKTTDGGLSWTTLGQTVFAGTRFSRLVVAPGSPGRLIAATGSGLFRSVDGGITWTKMTGSSLPGANATDCCIDPSSPGTVYAAFWGGGVYKTTSAFGSGQPSWTRLAGGLPASGFTRIGLALSPSSPNTIYALMAGLSDPNPSLAYLVNRFLRSTDGGATWSPVPLPGGNIGGQGFYNLNVAVDATTPDVVFLSGISLWKAVRNPSTGAWTVTNVGLGFHPDNHAFAQQTGNHLVVYAGSDGGIYRSADGGVTWSDTINEGPCITQFEFIDQHPTSDAVVFGGTQDNGTEQFRNSPVFNHADDGDGGYCAVDRLQPRNVISTYYSTTPKRSTEGGKFGTWFDVSSGISGASLFYPPVTLDRTNPSNMAIGTTAVCLDASQGTGGWPVAVPLPGLDVASERVSAIDYVTSNLIYAGTTDGKVYRLTKSGPSWTAVALQAAALPNHFVWDIAARPDDANAIVVVMSGFAIDHVWRGVVAAGGTSATWTSISGTGAGALPDIPVNALVIDPDAPDTCYIATDVAVFRTTNGGAAWSQFSSGLPNCAVFDLRLHQPTRLLRAATHGRGLWERQLDVLSLPAADLYVRDHVMATGRQTPSPSGIPAAFEDPLQHVALGDALWWWQCADLKVDALEGVPPGYQLGVPEVDYAAFESQLAHRNPQRGRVNRVYAQLHNRGIVAAANVTVKVLYADASAGLPPLPADFWTAFPNDPADATHWKPVGAARVLPSLSPTEPSVIEWDWTTPVDAAEHTCLLVVMDSPADPIPAAGKVLDVGTLVANEKRVGLKNLHVVDASAGTTMAMTVRLYARGQSRTSIRLLPGELGRWTVGLLLPRAAARTAAARRSRREAARAGAPPPALQGLTMRPPTATQLRQLRQQLGDDLTAYDATRLFSVEDVTRGAVLSGLTVPKAGLTAALILTAPRTAHGPVTLTVVQEEGHRVVGGNTFALRTTKQ